ncbi:hypothetical protein FGADI_6631 [Fusarium gaditjirri]|uniref:Uncharacterized protein n=1 Tax=Fusarium gaditjirri TaxID=282569 RepID=A0A8H4T764_9HYPO|nr:hypothetical protein FGADI_6631 [Fusarium gaditjirri]
MAHHEVRASGAITKPSSTRQGVEHASPIAYSHIAPDPGGYTRGMADLANVPRYKIFNNKEEAIRIPASHVLKYPAFEDHFNRSSRSRARRLYSGRCSCIIDIVAVFLRDGSSNFMHLRNWSRTDDMPKFAECIKPTDVLCLKLMYGKPATPEATGSSGHSQLLSHESLRQDLARLVMSLIGEPRLGESEV